MLQGASTDIFNQLVPKAENSECQNLLFPLQNKPVKVSEKLVCGIYFLHPCLGTNGLSKIAKFNLADLKNCD